MLQKDFVDKNDSFEKVEHIVKKKEKKKASTRKRLKIIYLRHVSIYKRDFTFNILILSTIPQDIKVSVSLNI